LFTTDGPNVLLETTPAGALQARNTSYPGRYGGLASQNRAGTSLFFGFDSQQSTRILVSIGGVITDSYSYKAFGEELQSGSGTVNPFRFVGQQGYFRDLPGIMNVGWRRLIAAIGTWLNRDLIGFAGGQINLYEYVGNNPVVLFDPSGLLPVLVAPSCSPPNPVCGANLDAWIGGEVTRQISRMAIFQKFIDMNGNKLIPSYISGLCPSASNSVLNLLGWANMNQGYKNMGAQLSIASGCPVSSDCANTATLCGYCLPLNQLGNIMYGLIGGFLKISIDDMTSAADCLKSSAGKPICFEKHDAYALGWWIYSENGSMTMTSANFCRVFNNKIQRYIGAVNDCTPNGNGMKEYYDCKACSAPPTAQPVPSGAQQPFNECWPTPLNPGLAGPNCT
jgi:RHS repeat-associated protein